MLDEEYLDAVGALEAAASENYRSFSHLTELKRGVSGEETVLAAPDAVKEWKMISTLIRRDLGYSDRAAPSCEIVAESVRDLISRIRVAKESSPEEADWESVLELTGELTRSSSVNEIIRNRTIPRCRQVLRDLENEPSQHRPP
ncbi:hypothetical protein NDN08_004997 [Rhodosorus marinus]|uniref:Uncharacterized protein n=1 Tax=Rhodosorus marinus TaxID=101924 RepID=A0AAV8UIN7_9RHOD|nr:hypothetical protein NDN08_004997 [Rhodosorus marinus]